MAAKALDVAKYGELLREAYPTVPRTAVQNERLIEIVYRLDQKPSLSREEKELANLLTTLIEQFEERHYATSRATPDEVLRELMRARDMKPKDLYEVFGSRGTTSEVVRGKRVISKNAAKKLAEIFHVGVDLFI
jgi:HTH-type transcriptional regulator/antitoxin HigA